MGRRHKKKVDLDPIIKRKKKRILNEKEIEEKKLEEEEQRKLEEEENELIDSEEVEKMLSEDEVEQEEDDKYKKFKESLNLRVDKNEESFRKYIENLEQIELEAVQISDEDYFKRHLEYDFEDLKKNYLNEVQQIKVLKVSEKEKIQAKMREIFYFEKTDEKDLQKKIVVNEQSIDPQKFTLQNKIFLKEFEIKKDLKKRKSYSVQCKEELLFDQNSEKNLISQKTIEGSKQQRKFFLKPDLYQDERILENYQNKFQNSQKAEFQILNQYTDLIRIDQEELQSKLFRNVYLTHILNHLLKCGPYDKMEEQENSETNGTEQNDTPNKGFTRCKVLILTPFKGDATAIIKILIQIFTNKEGIQKATHKQKFQELYEDEEKFAEDDFRIGISLSVKKNRVKLFTPFSNSDIIIASPLGLKLIIAEQEKKRVSFLSSIEILTLDRLSAMYMQNWEHLEDVLESLNKMPDHSDMTSSLDEIRPYFYENLSRFYRQNIIYSEFIFPELNSIRNRIMQNYRGSVMNKPFYFASIQEEQKLQEFVKIDISDFKNELNEKFEYFKQKIWDNWKNEYGVVLFCNSYFEFVKLKNHFTQLNVSFECISEYTAKNKIQQRISYLMKQKVKFILFSEKAYFYDLCRIRNFPHIFFYSLPKNAFIYQEILSNLSQKEGQKNKILSLFSKFDQLIVERIVGTIHAKQFMAEYNKSTSFVI